MNNAGCDKQKRMKSKKIKWRPMVAIAIDDGAYDSYANIYPILKKAGLPATFFMVTDYISRAGEYKNGMDPAGKPVPLSPEKIERNSGRGLFRLPMTLAQAEEMARDPLCELASHSADHSNRWDSICQGIKDLRKIIKAAGAEDNYPRRKDDKDGDTAKGNGAEAGSGVSGEEILLGFASPGSELSATELLQMQTALQREGVLYARSAMRLRTFRLLRILARKVSRVIHVGFLYAIAYGDTLIDTSDTFALNSIPVLHDISLEQVKSLVRSAERKKKSCILLFHSVTKEGELMYDDTWSWDAGKFERLLEFLKEEQAAGRIRVVKIRDVMDKQDTYAQ